MIRKRNKLYLYNIIDSDIEIVCWWIEDGNLYNECMRFLKFILGMFVVFCKYNNDV